MSNNKQSSVDFIHDSLIKYIGFEDIESTKIFDKIFEQAKAMHKDEHSNTWDESVDNYKKRGENDMRHWVDFDDYFNETFGGNNDQ